MGVLCGSSLLNHSCRLHLKQLGRARPGAGITPARASIYKRESRCCCSGKRRPSCGRVRRVPARLRQRRLGSVNSAGHDVFAAGAGSGHAPLGRRGRRVYFLSCHHGRLPGVTRSHAPGLRARSPFLCGSAREVARGRTTGRRARESRRGLAEARRR